MAKGSLADSNVTEEKAVIALDIEDETFHVGDAILVKGDNPSVPFTARISRFEPEFKGRRRKGTKIFVNWYYRPEETHCGRRVFHGKKELFRSNHVDTIQAETIMQKCEVHSLSKYRSLEEEASYDFYSRFNYDPVEKFFTPEIVPVYCDCEMPYNPDAYMIMCGRCENWYHPKCIGLTNKAAKRFSRAEQFYCPHCKETMARKKRKTSNA